MTAKVIAKSKNIMPDNIYSLVCFSLLYKKQKETNELIAKKAKIDWE